ncbi:LOW QUALITY PROTEIN: serine/threonine-protein kinase VRK1 [Chanos chanos]|uniref:LOW QUALITY PROTEIN: serine/threonine-protein kinase VRK1 n=1 Tax=Chanos chanos TaxID=29144 RepID=A0AC58UVU7_CHACN
MAPKKNTLPAPLPDGWILTDTEKKKWRLGKIIGKGGFGLIYLASQCVDAPVGENSNFVIKVEYQENGPLFTELKFYQRVAKTNMMQQWKKAKKLDFLGIPEYWGSGLSEYNGTRYRFMVMDRLGTDLQKIFLENGRQLKKDTVLQLGCLLLNALEYMHESEYVHADIKAANLLLGHRDPDRVYLADYGLSYRYCPGGVHKEYKENPKKGHNGTIEYTSLDAHRGVAPSRRGDLEVLGYCLLHWQTGSLPWLSALRNPSQVLEAKAKLMADLPDSVIRLSTPGCSTDEIAKFLLCVKALDYKARPDYQALSGILLEMGLMGPLDLSRPRTVEASRPDSLRVTPSPALGGLTSSGRAGLPAVEARSREGRSSEEGENQNQSRAKSPARRQARPKSAAWEGDNDDDDDDDEEDFKPVRVYHRHKAESKPREKKQRKVTSVTEQASRPKPAMVKSEEDFSDEDSPVPVGVQTRSRGGSRRKPPREKKTLAQTNRVVRTAEPNRDGHGAPPRRQRNLPESDYSLRERHSTAEMEDWHGNNDSQHDWARRRNNQSSRWEMWDHSENYRDRAGSNHRYWEDPGDELRECGITPGREYDQNREGKNRDGAQSREISDKQRPIWEFIAVIVLVFTVFALYSCDVFPGHSCR